jgi:lipoprotein-anchoring transpeptidase ErfK/SrfK
MSRLLRYARLLSRILPAIAAVSVLAVLTVRAAALPRPHSEERPGTTIEYRIERRVGPAQDLARRFATPQLSVLEKLNRADRAHLHRLDALVVPDVWVDELGYSPFPTVYDPATQSPKLLIVDQPSQAFAAYEWGHLVRWGPVSSGKRTSPTPSGTFHLNWRSRGRHSTVNPGWYMKWYFNFDNATGLSLHSYALPGYPASHGCIRLLERDAMWLYDWGDGWALGADGRAASKGTTLIVVGNAFEAPTPWRSPAFLARGVALPDTSLFEDGEDSVVKQPVRREHTGVSH